MKQKRNDIYRLFQVKNLNGSYRSEYNRDYARVLHSYSFRRLEHKTQLFPGHESDFFRNRLTHSLEVAHIAKTIAIKLLKSNPRLPVLPDVCEVAGLMHDLGHPPFGHNGEKALDKCMLRYGGFEGNAQTLRIICKLEKKEIETYPPIIQGIDYRVGLNLTARSIASIIKNDKVIPISRADDSDFVKGYYNSEEDIVKCIKEKLNCSSVKTFKTIECSIMDLADDIAYSTYDIEDAFKAGFLSPYEIMSVSESILEQICKELEKEEIYKTKKQCRDELYDIFAETWEEHIVRQKALEAKDEKYTELTMQNIISSYDLSRKIAANGYFRTTFTSRLVNEFINGVRLKSKDDNTIMSNVKFTEKIKFRVNLLKRLAFTCLINSSMLKVAENRSQDFVIKLFNKLTESNGYKLLPEDFQELYLYFDTDLDRKRLICDFIAGMTDRYALEFYGRLFSENPQSIFKPM
jgi:dGTPase